MEQHRNCVVCRRGLYHNRYQRHILTEDLPQIRPDFARLIQQNALLEIEFNNTRAVCHRCWQRIDVELAAQPAPAVQPEPAVLPAPANQPVPDVQMEPEPEPESVIHMNQYFRAPNTARHCLFNNCQNGDRHRIPEMIKSFLLCEYKLYVPENARICQHHLRGNDWDTLLNFCNVSHDFNADQMTALCDLLIKAARRPHRLDFENENALSNDEMHFWTGRDINQFQLILEETPSLVERCNRPKTALGIYLCKLRTGEPNVRLATLFAMTRRTLEKLLKIARECLSNEYVSQHLGLDHITRNDVIQRNLLLPRVIFGNEQNTQAILICDGTYIYIQKSSNFLFQRQSYSLHKYRNLLKPFLIVCTDGYILDVLGPYAATESDATIMNNIIKRVDHPLHWFLEENDPNFNFLHL